MSEDEKKQLNEDVKTAKSTILELIEKAVIVVIIVVIIGAVAAAVLTITRKNDVEKYKVTFNEDHVSTIEKE